MDARRLDAASAMSSAVSFGSWEVLFLFLVEGGSWGTRMEAVTAQFSVTIMELGEEVISVYV